MKLKEIEKEEGKADVLLYCVFGRAPDMFKEVTWYRYRPSGNVMKMLTMDPDSIVTYENVEMKGKIDVVEQQKSHRNRTTKLLNVKHTDISKYWCEVKPPNIFRNDWRNSSLLRVKGLNLKIILKSLLQAQ